MCVYTCVGVNVIIVPNKHVISVAYIQLKQTHILVKFNLIHKPQKFSSKLEVSYILATLFPHKQITILLYDQI